MSTVRSLPLWECGLKSQETEPELMVVNVTPLVGVWIEIKTELLQTVRLRSHSPCGSVD